MANNEEHLTKSDYYNAAAQFLNQEYKTLGDRSNAFLITQSILLAAFIYIVTSQNLHAPEYILWGITIAGIWLCFFYFQAGRAGSEAAFRWRKYMRSIEKGQPRAPWNWIYRSYKHKHGREDTYKNLLSRLICQRCWLDRSPLPIAWLISPAIFFAVWIGTTYYLHTTEQFILACFQTITINISLAIAASFMICKAILWWQKQI